MTPVRRISSQASAWPIHRAALLLAAVYAFSFQPAYAETEWLKLTPDGRLQYGADRQGNRIPDFSAVGFREGLQPIPKVEARYRLSPSGRDDSERLQELIDKLAQERITDNGFRGAIELSPGKFSLSRTLKVSTSGVVIRGAGQERTQIFIDRGIRPVITIAGTGNWKRILPAFPIADDYVPVGANSISIRGPHDLKPGERVIVQRPTTTAWISEIGMDRLPPRRDGGTVNQWRAGSGLHFDRVVTEVKGGRIVLNAPLTNGISAKDGGLVWRYEFPGRIRNIGLEALSIHTPMPGAVDRADPGATRDLMVVVNAAEDIFFRDIEASGFGSFFVLRDYTRAIMIERFHGRSGDYRKLGWLPGSISVDGQQVLVQDCLIEGEHVLGFVTQSFVAGPNVFRQSEGRGEVYAGAHQRWGTGTLFEDLRIGGTFEIRNRGSMGTGHGWAGANMVVWNVRAGQFLIENPPTARNWIYKLDDNKKEAERQNAEEIAARSVKDLPSLFMAQRQARGK